MNKDTDTANDYFEDFDLAGAKTIKHPLIQKIQQTNELLEEDIATWLSTQDSETKQHINAVIRHFMQVKEAVSNNI